jgi:broad specificity phosphatase PhoE
MVKKLVIVRHSLREDYGPDKTSSKNGDPLLSIMGKRKCLDTKNKIEDLVGTIDKTYTSPLKRTLHTAILLCDEMYSIHEECLLVEGQDKSPPSFSDELVTRLKNEGIKYPETMINIKLRCNKMLQKVKHDFKDKDTVLLVTRGIGNVWFIYWLTFYYSFWISVF